MNSLAKDLRPDVTHGVAKLALPAKASLGTPKLITVGRQSFADGSTGASA